MLSGLIDPKDLITNLGVRNIEKGYGPMGIVHAYYPHMKHHAMLLTGKSKKLGVVRGENIAASQVHQDANKRTFKMTNEAIDDFCKK